MKKPSLKPKFIAEVEWLDAITSHVGETFTTKKAKEMKPVKRVSVGYLVLVDKDRVIIAATWDPAADDEETDDFVEITTIPAAWICKIKRYKT